MQMLNHVFHRLDGLFYFAADWQDVAVKMQAITKSIDAKNTIGVFDPGILSYVPVDLIPIVGDHQSRPGMCFRQNHVIGLGSTCDLYKEIAVMVKEMNICIGIGEASSSLQNVARIGVKHAPEVARVLGEVQYDRQEIRQFWLVIVQVNEIEPVHDDEFFV